MNSSMVWVREEGRRVEGLGRVGGNVQRGESRLVGRGSTFTPGTTVLAEDDRK